MDYYKPYISYFPYFVETPPASLPVTLDEVKEHLKLDPTDASQDAYLTLLISAATEFCEEYTRRTLIYTEFKTYRNFFAARIELRRSIYQSLTSFKYTVSGSLITVDPTLYYTTKDKDYSSIVLNENQCYPSDGDDSLQGIEIIFVAGLGATSTDIPPKLKLGLLNHIASLYENRGDCDKASIIKTLPNASKEFYNGWQIKELV